LGIAAARLAAVASGARLDRGAMHQQLARQYPRSNLAPSTRDRAQLILLHDAVMQTKTVSLLYFNDCNFLCGAIKCLAVLFHI
jgi:hypothetical protein